MAVKFKLLIIYGIPRCELNLKAVVINSYTQRALKAGAAMVSEGYGRDFL
jgi:hypothetical protein